MKSAVENLEPTRVKLTVEVSYDELKPSLDHAYSHIAEQVNVPGFRKGKVPPRVLEQRVGRAAVIEHAVNDAVPGFYNQAVAETEVRPMGQPSINVTEIPAVTGTPGGQLVFEAEVDVRPEITLPALDGLEITVDEAAVADDDVTAKLDELRERFGTLVGVDRPAQDGDFVVIDLSAKIGDEEIDSVSGVSYQIGAGNMLDGLDEALTGLTAGETTTFTASLAGGEHAGEEAEVTVTPTAVKERELPEADDEFAQLASEFDTIDELLEDLRGQAAKDKASDQAVQARDLLLERLRGDVEIPVPSGVVEAEIGRHLEAEGKEAGDPHGEEVREEITDLLRDQMLLDTLVDQLSVGVTQNELLEFLVSSAQQYGMEPNQFIQAASQTGQIQAFMGEIARNKALAVALRQVSVKDSEGNEVDLSEYIGSDELDAAGPEGEAGSTESPESAESAESPESPESAESPESPESAESAESAASPEEPAEATTDEQAEVAEEPKPKAEKKPAKKAAKKSTAKKTEKVAEEAGE
ncbi:trigger factor [Georgenia soli]|uniref:Trigger factor n=1 Tax=Georgenia soli TaxID=638953 RepID=A0A2A9EHK3_9MICO|nr:trigger factor [Georgenia soli]PFG38547.1 trigger factor [Georgenia soli]